MIENWRRLKRQHAKKHGPKGAGVYCLFAGDVLVYVGRTKFIRDRIREHKHKAFDSFAWRLIKDPNERYQLEADLIFVHRPTFNKHVMKSESISEIRKGGEALIAFRKRQGTNPEDGR